MWSMSLLTGKLVAFGKLSFIQVSKGISPRCMIILPGPDDYVAALGSAIGRPARLFFRLKCDVTVSNWSDEREGQNEQVPPYSMCIRTAFVVCIRRGEITGAASRGKQPDRSSEDELDPCRCFWNNRADRLFLRSQPRLLR